MKPSEVNRTVRQKLRAFLLTCGYRVDSTRYIPKHMLDEANLVRLAFDHAVCRLMVNLGRPLNFIQVGAFDGTTGDPVYPYISNHGWRGILIEPQETAFEALRQLHGANPRIEVVKAAVGRENGSATLYTVCGNRLPAWCGGLASFSKESILKHVALEPELARSIVSEQVTVRSFRDILAQSKTAEFDLLQIDTEGGDAEILRLFPFETIRPSIVHWEIKHLSKAETEECLKHLLSYGYRFAASGDEDMLAILAEPFKVKAP